MKDITLTLEYTPQPTRTAITIGASLRATRAAKSYVVLCDEMISHPLFDHALLVLPLKAGESLKTREMKQWVEDQLLRAGAHSGTELIAIGGGTICDLAGFVAATYCRGIRYSLFPTTLLAMCDASIGGKNGVNVHYAKNFIGTLYQPSAVFMDIDFLKSLPQEELKNGLVELVKHTLLDGISIDIVPLLERDQKALIEAITHSVRYKTMIVEASCTKPQIRDLLNFGHTIGHAIESLEQFRISHGEAVGIGIMAECMLSSLPEERIEAIHKQIRSIALPFSLSRGYSKSEWQEALSFDKKSQDRCSKPRFVLLDQIDKEGVSYCHEVDDDRVYTILEWVNRECCSLSSKQ